METVDAFFVESSHPFVGALAAHTHRLGDMRHRPAALSDSFDKQTTGVERQPGITVRHEDLLDRVKRANSTMTQGSSPSQRSVTNVLTEYS